MKTFIKSLLIFFIFTAAAHSYDYVAKRATDIDTIAKKFHRNVSYLEYDDYIANLKIWNDHIPDFNNIPAGTELYVIHPHCPFLLGCGYDKPLRLGDGTDRVMASYEEEEPEEEAEYASLDTKRKKKKDRTSNYYYSLDLTFTAYQRKNRQDMDQGLDYWKSTQNSPLTFETAFVVIPKRIPYYYEFKLGVSYLMPSDSNIDKKLPNVLEYRGGAYFRYRLPKFRRITVKGGLHYRHHIAFDLGTLARTGEVKQYNYEIGYLAGGAGYRHEFNSEFVNVFDVTLYRSFAHKDNYNSQNVDSSIVLIENTVEYNDIFFGGFYQYEKSRVAGHKGKTEYFGIRIGFTPF